MSLFRFEQEVKTLEQTRAPGMTSLITLLLPPGSENKLDDVIRLVEDGRILITEEKDVFQPLEYIGYESDALLAELKAELKSIKIGRNGTALFMGWWPEDDKCHRLRLRFDDLPSPITRHLFAGHWRFFTEDVRAIFQRAAGVTHGLIVFDVTGLLCSSAHWTEIKHLQKVGMQLRHLQIQPNPEAWINIFDAVNKAIENTYSAPSGGYSVNGFIIGGKGPYAQKLKDRLDPPIRSKVLKVVETEGEEEDAVKELISLAADVMPDLRLVQERQEMAALAAADRTGKAVKGAEATISALAEGRLSSVLVSGDCTWYQCTGMNPFSEKEVTTYWEEGTEGNDEYRMLNDIKKKKLITELVLGTLAHGTPVQVISKGTREGVRFWQQEQIAGILK